MFYALERNKGYLLNVQELKDPRQIAMHHVSVIILWIDCSVSFIATFYSDLTGAARIPNDIILNVEFV